MKNDTSLLVQLSSEKFHPSSGSSDDYLFIIFYRCSFHFNNKCSLWLNRYTQYIKLISTKSLQISTVKENICHYFKGNWLEWVVRVLRQENFQTEFNLLKSLSSVNFLHLKNHFEEKSNANDLYIKLKAKKPHKMNGNWWQKVINTLS